MLGRLKASEQDWAACVSIFLSGLKWEIESQLSRDKTREDGAANDSWEDSQRRTELRQALRIEAAFVLARYLSNDDAFAQASETSERLLLEALDEDPQSVLAKMNLALVLCHKPILRAARKWRDYSSFALRNCPELLPMHESRRAVSQISGQASWARKYAGGEGQEPTLQTAEELLLESISAAKAAEHRLLARGRKSSDPQHEQADEASNHHYHTQHHHTHHHHHMHRRDPHAHHGEWASEWGMSRDLDVPWASPRREELPPHFLSHALLFLGHLQRYTRGPEAALDTYCASASRYCPHMPLTHPAAAASHVRTCNA